jgi:HEPN domain-containing protein
VQYPVVVPIRWADWFRQAEADLSHARHALAGAHYEWACFAAQQSAEKALKAVHGARQQEAWGHSVTELLVALDDRSVSAEMVDRGRALDKLYIATRYPNGLPVGAPADYYTRPEAERAISDGEAILDWCRGVLPR